jgi:hypothetical protein
MMQSSNNPNAFACTFAFFTTHNPLLKKAKELASHRTTNRKDSTLTQTTFVDREARSGIAGISTLYAILEPPYRQLTHIKKIKYEFRKTHFRRTFQ